jgi:ABC-type cobalamin/Fe3+-siderophores transport system ATPase subunit
MIEVNNIYFSVKTKSLLQNISFKAKTGEFWAIVGANGAGKSTLLKVLSKEFFSRERFKKIQFKGTGSKTCRTGSAKCHYAFLYCPGNCFNGALPLF